MSNQSNFLINGQVPLENMTIKEGSTMVISRPGAKMVLGGFYQPPPYGLKIAFENFGDSARVIVKRTSMSLKGSAELRLRAYLENWSSDVFRVTINVI